MFCASCGESHRPNAKFCSACRAPVENDQATVLVTADSAPSTFAGRDANTFPDVATSPDASSTANRSAPGMGAPGLSTSSLPTPPAASAPNYPLSLTPMAPLDSFPKPQAAGVARFAGLLALFGGCAFLYPAAKGLSQMSDLADEFGGGKIKAQYWIWVLVGAFFALVGLIALLRGTGRALMAITLSAAFAIGIAGNAVQVNSIPHVLASFGGLETMWKPGAWEGSEATVWGLSYWALAAALVLCVLSLIVTASKPKP
jgi:hypothetical protein